MWGRVQALLVADKGRTASTRPSQVVPTVFGTEYLRKSRPGQAGFRAGLTLAYDGRCAVTGENIAPVLQAAHIMPVSRHGTNEITNGLLLRSDMHTLYDDGLIGVTPDYRIVISDQIKEQYVNGKIYYRWHGEQLTQIPKDVELRPDREKLEWHMSEIFER